MYSANKKEPPAEVRPWVDTLESNTWANFQHLSLDNGVDILTFALKNV